jgi:hypothetical protein
MNFSTAIDLFKNQRCMFRRSWGAFTYVGMHTPAMGFVLTLPYFFRCSEEGTEPWFPTLEDMFAEDWDLVSGDLADNWPNYVVPGLPKETPADTPVPTVEEMAAFNKRRILRAKKAKEAKEAKAKKANTARVIDPEAPWGRKKDGTPAKRRGPAPVVHTIGATSEAPLI